MSTLRQAAQQALEALHEIAWSNDSRWQTDRAESVIPALRAALAQEEDDPHPPSRHCMCEACKPAFEPTPGPEQEPVAWRYKGMVGMPWSLSDDGYYVSCKRDKGYMVEPLYTAPPQLLPLTEKEILSAVGWERAEMYMKLTPNFPIEEARKETIKNARAIEAALKEKNA